MKAKPSSSPSLNPLRFGARLDVFSIGFTLLDDRTVFSLVPPIVRDPNRAPSLFFLALAPPQTTECRPD